MFLLFGIFIIAHFAFRLRYLRTDALLDVFDVSDTQAIVVQRIVQMFRIKPGGRG